MFDFDGEILNKTYWKNFWECQTELFKACADVAAQNDVIAEHVQAKSVDGVLWANSRKPKSHHIHKTC